MVEGANEEMRDYVDPPYEPPSDVWDYYDADLDEFIEPTEEEIERQNYKLINDLARAKRRANLKHGRYKNRRNRT
jgi:hypothetical protein